MSLGEKDLNADLVFSKEGQSIALKAADGIATIYLQKFPIKKIIQEVQLLDRLHLLDKFAAAYKKAGWRVYLKYGPLKFRMPRPRLLRILIRFFGVF